jgi:hypothetical protein
VEWVATLAVVSLLLLGVLAVGVRVPGASLALAIGDRILCAVAIGDGCGDEPELIAAYGDEVGRLVRRHMPTIVFEAGSRAVPVDFRRCRSTECGDATGEGLVHRTDERLPVTAFVHVVDCRDGERTRSEEEGADCSGSREGNLYIQYWTYYADSATLRGVPIAGDRGYHEDDWEGVQVRIRRDGSTQSRASSHHGYNSGPASAGNWGSDAGIGPIAGAAGTVGIRGESGWGSEIPYLFVSGGSHAGNTFDEGGVGRFTPGRRVHLVPLEPIAAESGAEFAVSAPWRKHVWRDPEASGTD